MKTPRQIKMYYAHINNMGDILNGLLLSKVFHRDEAPKSRIYDFDIMGIGSCLDAMVYGDSLSKQRTGELLREKALSAFSKKGYIWGTGFLKEYDFSRVKLKRKNVEFVMVRGELTKRAVSSMLGHTIDIPMADGGLLAPMLIEDENIEKKYDIGIIPHFREKGSPMIDKIEKIFGGGYSTCTIDVQEDPISVIRKIAECRFIISSSLHGLIVADSFGIPNTRIKLTDAPLGTGFKFDDYYSAYGICKPPVGVADNKELSIEDFFSVSQVDVKQVEEKKAQLIEGMHYILSSI